MRKFLFLVTAMVLSLNLGAVTFRVQVPDGTRQCFVCGDFNGWNDAAALRMEQESDNIFKLDAPNVTDVSKGFKYLCGQSWDYVEKDANGGEIDDRTVLGNPDVVGSWRNVPEYGIESFEINVNGVPRLIKVYLPENYNETTDIYPVIYYNTVQQRYSNSGDDGNPGDYFFGQGSWNAHYHLQKHVDEGNSPYIMVQICSFLGENTIEAHPEYIGSGNAANYLQAFITEFIPEINSRYRVDKTRKSVIIGADYAAIFSIYAASTHPEVFGTCVAMSPMLWINADAVSSLTAGDEDTIYYITAGSREPQWLIDDTEAFAKSLEASGATVYYTLFDGGSHNDKSWGAAFPKILKAVATGTKPDVPEIKDEEDNDFKTKQFALYSTSNPDYLTTNKQADFVYTAEYYKKGTTAPIEAFIATQTIAAKYQADYYWNVSKGPDSSFGWLFDSNQKIGFSNKRTEPAWQRVQVFADGSTDNIAAIYNGFTVKTSSGTVKMTSNDDYTATATVAFPGDDKTFTIHYGSVNSGSDMGDITDVYKELPEDCTEAEIVYDFATNKITCTVTKSNGGDVVVPTPEPDFKDRVFTLYASDNQNDLKKVGTFTYTDEYYKKGSAEAVPAFVITHDVAASYKAKYYWNIAKGNDNSDGWLLSSPKDIGFSNSHNVVSWLNVAIYEDGNVDNIAAHSQGFSVVNGSNNKVKMTPASGYTSTATVSFPTADKSFTVHFGSVNSASDQGAVTPSVSVSQNCLEAVVTYDFNINKVTVRETKFGLLENQPKVSLMQAVPAVAIAGKDVSVNISLNKACNVSATCKHNFTSNVATSLVKESDTSYRIALAAPTEGIYTFTVSLSDGSTTVADAATMNVRVLSSGTQEAAKKLTVNAYSNVNWNTTNRYKANFHTHTSQSFDTQYSTSTVVDRYKNAGYKILALTDHDANSYPWTMFDLYNAEAEPRNPADMGMLAIPGNELSKDRRNNWSETTGGEFNHHNDLFTGRKGQEFMSLRESYAYTEALGGMQIINHPGQYWNRDTEYAKGAKNSPEWHADNFKQYSSLVGLEVYNQGNRRPYDRILWDQILTLTMPGRPVWGYSCDDTHSTDQYFRNYQFMLMPELTVDALKDAMTAGATVFSYEFTGSGEDKAPHIESISVDESQNLITIKSNDADDIEWIYSAHRTGTAASTTQSTVIAKGNTFDYSGFQGSYVRARLVNQYGETATQPFGFEADTSTVVDAMTGLQEDKKIEVLYDRDTKELTVTSTEPMQRITVLNAAGAIVKYAECKGLNTVTMRVADLAPGVHIVVAATDHTAYTEKFVN